MYYLINKQGTYRFDETAIRSIVSNTFSKHDEETGRITLRYDTVFTFQDGTKQSYQGPLSDFYLARHFVEGPCATIVETTMDKHYGTAGTTMRNKCHVFVASEGAK